MSIAFNSIAIALPLIILPVILYRILNKKQVNTRKRSVSFNSFNLINGSFIDKANVKSPIINIVQLYENCPTVDNLVIKLSQISKYDRFRCAIRKVNGLWSFVETNGIDIRRDHISESYVNNESELFASIESIVRSDLKGYNQRPLWHVHRIQNNGKGSSSLVIRIHHVIGDGISLVGTLMPLFTDISTGLPIENDIPSKMRSAESNFPKPSLFALMKAAFEVLYLTISPYDSDIKFTSPNKSQLVMTPTRKTILLPTLKLEFIKELKNKANVTVNDILLSCLTGAIVKYCEHFNDPIIHSPSIVNRVLLPVAFPRSSDTLHDSQEALINKWAFMNCHLALKATNAKERLLETNKITKNSKFSPNAFVQLWIQTNIMQYMPLFIQKQGAYDLVSRHSLILSNVPGPEQLLSFCNEKLIGVQVIFENLIPQVMSVSYGGLIFTNLNIDTDVIVDSEKLIPDYFLQELNELASAYGFHVNENDIVNRVKDDNVFSVII